MSLPESSLRISSPAGSSADVRFGSLADIEVPPVDVRFTPKTDIARHGCDVRFVPKADSCAAAILSLFDHLVGARE